MNRDKLYSRALLIVMCRRDVAKCVEEFSLYNSVARILDKDEYEGEDCSVENACELEAMYSPFSLKDLKVAVGESLELAEKELNDERSS